MADGWAKTIILNNSGYEPFIDFLKGSAILFVVLNHCLPELNKIGFCFWGGQAVPLFLIIQSWHIFKRGSEIDIRKYITKLSAKVIVPFFLIESLLFVLECIAGYESENLFGQIKAFVRSGGAGPGAYYIWVYLQMAVLLPLCKWMTKHISGKMFCLLLLSASCIAEILCSLFECPYYLYRLLAVRYLFLVWFVL